MTSADRFSELGSEIAQRCAASHRQKALAGHPPAFVAVYTAADLAAHRHCVYALLSPYRPHKVMYVGQTVSHALSRFAEHIREAERGCHRLPRQRWVAKMLSRGKVPALAVIEIVPPGADLTAVEQKWIRFYKYRGQAKLNQHVAESWLYGLRRSAP